MRVLFSHDWHRNARIRSFTLINAGYLAAGNKQGVMLGLLGFNLMIERKRR